MVRASEPPFQPAQSQASQGVLYFANTRHNLAPPFADYWQTHGGLQLYGCPVSEATSETSPTDGKNYLTQYFERARLEYHPELPQDRQVVIGLLGYDVLHAYSLVL